MHKQLVSCGCSITHGYFETAGKPAYLDSYSDLLAARLGFDSVNLAKPGASNYLIAKQVEFAVTHLNPSLIVVGLTSPYRFDYREESNLHDATLPRIPVLSDWDYKSMSKSIHTTGGGLYNTNPIPRLKLMPSRREFLEYTLKYVDVDLTADKDRFVVGGLLRFLESSGIPIVCVDWMQLLPPTTDHIPAYICTELNWPKYREQFTTDDGGHFDSAGHDQAAATLLNFVKLNNILG